MSPSSLSPQQPADLRLRTATEHDAATLAALYYDTIHRVNCRDYSPAQCLAWAPPESRQPQGWVRKQANRLTLVAEKSRQIVGFGELEPGGHIDCFYVHYAWQRRGIGRSLLAGLEAAARQQQVTDLFVEASVTAQPFFLAMGYLVVRHQQVERRGEWLANAVMKKQMDQSSAWVRGVT